MIAQVIYLLFVIGFILSFINPIFGLCFLVGSLLTYPETYAPLLSKYHINLILAVAIFINCIVRRKDFIKINYLIASGIFIAICFYVFFYRRV